MGGAPGEVECSVRVGFSGGLFFLAWLPELLLVVVVYSSLFHSLPVSGSCFKLGFPLV
jgi:hypothetical protein